MNRRALLMSVGVLSTGPVAGCLSALDPTGTASPTATSQKETGGLSATVTTVTYDGTAGENEEEVSISVDCVAQNATLRGWFSTSSCRTVAIQGLQYDRTEGFAELVLYPRWTESQPPENVDCAGASYRYSVELTAQEQLPTEFRVVYKRPDERTPTQFTARNDECS